MKKIKKNHKNNSQNKIDNFILNTIKIFDATIEK